MITLSIFILMFLKAVTFFRSSVLAPFFVHLMYSRRKHWAALLLSFLMACFISSASFSAGLQGYTLGPQDVLKIEVWDNPDLSREVTVSLMNTISFPLIGEMNVEGHTAEKLQEVLRSRLADGYLVSPQVTVTVKEYNSKKVYVLGEVNKPGDYPFSKVTALVGIISMAGGLTPDAGQEAYILRSSEKIDPNNITQLIQGRKHNSLPSETSVDSLTTSRGKDISGDPTEKSRVITLTLNDFNQGVNLNFELQNNDTLYIPKAKFFYVVGEVKSPGRFKLEKEINVLQTISMAGGLTQRASEKKVKILRTIDGKEQGIKAKMTDLVLPDDIIRVPESFF